MPKRRLTRSLTDRALAGICGGLGTYLGLNPWWLRLGFILFALFTLGVSGLIYVALWLVLPQQNLGEVLGQRGLEPEASQGHPETLILLGGGVALLGLASLAVSLDVLQGARGDVLLPFVILSLGLILLAQQLRKGTS